MKLDLPTDVGMLFDLPADSTSKVIWCRRAADRYCRSNKKDNGRDRQRRDRSVKMLKIRELLCCADRACCMHVVHELHHMEQFMAIDVRIH